MAERKLSNTIRNASAVNLKYSADLLNLGRQYVQAFTRALSEGQAEEADESSADRIPLLLAGKAGETANAAFAVNNPGNLKGTVTLAYSGDFSDTKIRIEPERLSFEDGKKEIVVRVLAKIGRKTAEETNYAGTIFIPDMDYRITDFVVRKLPI